MILALGVAFLPNGGNVAEAVMAALLMAMLAGVAWMVYELSRQNRLTLDSLPDSRRAILYGAVGLIGLLIVGSQTFFDTGPGTLAWIVLLGGSMLAIWRVWMDAKTY